MGVDLKPDESGGGGGGGGLLKCEKWLASNPVGKSIDKSYEVC